MDKLSNIKKQYLEESEVVFTEFLRYLLTNGVKLTKEEIGVLLIWSGEEEYFENVSIQDY